MFSEMNVFIEYKIAEEKWIKKVILKMYVLLFWWNNGSWGY